MSSFLEAYISDKTYLYYVIYSSLILIIAQMIIWFWFYYTYDKTLAPEFSIRSQTNSWKHDLKND